jgi:hypothetical protein
MPVLREREASGAVVSGAIVDQKANLFASAESKAVVHDACRGHAVVA